MYAMWSNTENYSIPAGPAEFPAWWTDDQIRLDWTYQHEAVSYGVAYPLQDIWSSGCQSFHASRPAPSISSPDDALRPAPVIDRTGPKSHRNLPAVLATVPTKSHRVMARFAITPAASTDQLNASWLSVRHYQSWTHEQQCSNRQGWIWAVERTDRKAVLQAWISDVDCPRILLDERAVWVSCIHYDDLLYITLQEAVDVLALCSRYKLEPEMRSQIVDMLARRRWIACKPKERKALISHIRSIPAPPARNPAQGFMKWSMFEHILLKTMQVRGQH